MFIKNSKKNTNHSADLEDFLNSHEDSFTTNFSKLYSFYISGELKSPENYFKMFNAIRYATESDYIKIHINSMGGDVSTAIQFMHVMRESNAIIEVSIEGNCMSAATMILLAADIVNISDFSMFLFHNYSGGSFGKGGEMLDQIQFERKWSENMISNIYKHFLSDSEIIDILNNKDIWMDGDEVIKRLKFRADKLKIEEE